jgi:hypothetical protein
MIKHRLNIEHKLAECIARLSFQLSIRVECRGRVLVSCSFFSSTRVSLKKCKKSFNERWAAIFYTSEEESQAVHS